MSAVRGDPALDDTEVAATAPAPAALEIGVRVGRYVVEGQLGAGGMGVVYAARDPDLDRRVALKLLYAAPGSTALLREGQAMARVSHPNVVAVYDVGNHGDDVFIAMELVVGRTLGAWLRQRSRSQRQIVDLFLSAGQGLAAAHAAGLVHRDFKPDNVLLGDDGRVRVGDFGLARAAHVEPSPGSPGPSSSSPLLTSSGSIVGTPLYMSPEQHAGGATDHHTDQFSFCVALWRALTGVHPFGEGEVRDVVARLRRGELAPAAGRRLPKRLRRVLERGLRLEQAARYPQMTALLADLAGSRPVSRRFLLLGAAAAALFAAGAGVSLPLMLREPAAPTAAATPPAPPPRQAVKHRKLTSSGRASSPDASRDGRLLAYVDRDVLRLRSLDGDGGDDRVLLRGELEHPRFSPDGKHLLVARDQALLLLPIDGGAPRQLSPAPLFAWAAGGAAVATAVQEERRIVVRDLDGPGQRELSVPGGYQFLIDLDYAPATARFLVTVREGNQTVLVVVDERSGDGREVHRHPDAEIEARWDFDGEEILLLVDGEPGELRRLPLGGQPQPLITGIEIGDLAPLPGGRLAYVRQDGVEHLWTVKRGEEPTPLTSGTDDHAHASVSPDGSRVAFIKARSELHVMPFAGGESRRIDVPSGLMVDPAWSPDGRRLAVVAGDGQLWIVPADGGPGRALGRLRHGRSPDLAWAPAPRILYHEVGHQNFVWVDPETGAETSLLPTRIGRCYDALPAPDGRVALYWDRDRPGVYLTDGTRLGDAGVPIGWSADSRWLFLARVDDKDPAAVSRLDVRSGAREPWLLPPPEDAWLMAARMHPDGEQALYSVVQVDSDVWLAEGL